MPDTDGQKRAAAEAAVAEVRAGMIVGLGTGSTAAFMIAALAARRLDIRAVATSQRTEALAYAAGIAIIDLPARIDLAIDGVDEIAPGLAAIKGAGGAMLREKVVATAAARMIAIADASKWVSRIGARPVPVEVPPFALAFVAARLAALGGAPVERAGYRTDGGNAVLDCRFATLPSPAEISAIPGVLGHGLFVDEIDTLYLGTDTGVQRFDRPNPRPDGF